MKSIIIVLIVCWILSIIFRWFWNFFLRDFCIIMLPPSDDPNADEMEDLFRAYDKTYTDKKRKKK